MFAKHSNDSQSSGELTAMPGLIEQGRKKYAALLRHHARQAAGLSIPLTMPAPLAQAA